MNKEELKDLITLVVNTTVEALEKKHLISDPNKKTAYQKTEQLLYNYNNFKKIVADRQQEILELRTYGVPQKSASIVEYTSGGGNVQGTVLPEESVENAVRNVLASVEITVQAISMVDKAMYALRKDPYYEILEMRYFEGRTQEDIAHHYSCSQMNISKNKSRLVRELSMQLFPDQVAQEMLQ